MTYSSGEERRVCWDRHTDPLFVREAWWPSTESCFPPSPQTDRLEFGTIYRATPGFTLYPFYYNPASKEELLQRHVKKKNRPWSMGRQVHRYPGQDVEPGIFKYHELRRQGSPLLWMALVSGVFTKSTGSVQSSAKLHHKRPDTPQAMAGEQARILQMGMVARSPEGHAAKGMAIKGREDLWVDIQANTFRNWVNEHLRGTKPEVRDLTTDLCDGTRLCALVEVLQKKRIRPAWIQRPANQHHYLENVSAALGAVAADGVKLVNIGLPTHEPQYGGVAQCDCLPDYIGSFSASQSLSHCLVMYYQVIEEVERGGLVRGLSEMLSEGFSVRVERLSEGFSEMLSEGFSVRVERLSEGFSVRVERLSEGFSERIE
uniref:Calponin-homology (CH) domain-containing protein n=1 Tax=Timema monikensis TaxID=170555 RepID=A0A7R9EHF4_9NEOP|nr:unnamed protein product [Timema monikensis]